MPDRPTLFVDRSLGKGVVNALRDAGARVEFHDDHFSQDAEDVEWIPKVSENGWVILTKDKHIRRSSTNVGPSSTAAPASSPSPPAT